MKSHNEYIDSLQRKLNNTITEREWKGTHICDHTACKDGNISTIQALAIDKVNLLTTKQNMEENVSQETPDRDELAAQLEGFTEKYEAYRATNLDLAISNYNLGK